MSHLVLLFWHPECLPLYDQAVVSVTDRVRPAKTSEDLSKGRCSDPRCDSKGHRDQEEVTY